MLRKRLRKRTRTRKMFWENKMMKRALKYLLIVLLANVLFCQISLAENKDNGRDANNTLIVSKILTLRCGLSSSDPGITEDCIRRLAYDYKTDLPPGYENYELEKKAIINDYARAYLFKAINQKVLSGGYEDRIDELIKQDPTVSVELDNDSREKMEFNNKLASDNSSVFLQAIDMRSSIINFDNINNILNNIVKETDVDTEDTSWGMPPS